MSRAAPKILAIESSCDETACAIVEGLQVRTSIIASQVEIHAAYGGVVPELASRHHLTAAVPVLRAAVEAAGIELAALDGLAVTEGPGLVGALLVGVQLAQGLALATGLPLYGIHHMEGHLLSPFLGDETLSSRPFVPHLALSVSGGHSELVLVEGLGHYRVLGCTRDDAAGEAFDKVAKLLGLGYPGGPVIDRLAAEGDPTSIHFPRAMLADRTRFEFSFSGLKTAVSVHVDQHGHTHTVEADKESDVALVSLKAADGRRALPVFTSIPKLTQWHKDARPVAVWMPRACLSAVDEGNDLVVVDPGAHLTYVVRRPEVYALAQQRQWTPSYEDVEIAEELSGLTDLVPGLAQLAMAPGRGVGTQTADGKIVAGGGAGPELALVATPHDPTDAIGNKLMLATMQSLIADQPLLSARADTVEIVLGTSD